MFDSFYTRWNPHYSSHPYAYVLTDDNDEDNEKNANSEETRVDRKRIFSDGLSNHTRLVVSLLVVGSLIISMSAYLYGAEVGSRRARSEGFIPFFPYTKEPVVFSPDKRWHGTGPDANALWLSEFDNGKNKFIKIDDPRKYGLKPGKLDADGNEWFAFSLYHQLHCVAAIRFITQAIPVKSIYNSHHDRREADSNFSAQNLEHLDHCFDYLRQSIRCSADTTLEWVPRDGENLTMNDSKGWGIPHRQCKNIDVIDDFIEQHRLG